MNRFGITDNGFLPAELAQWVTPDARACGFLYESFTTVGNERSFQTILWG